MAINEADTGLRTEVVTLPGLYLDGAVLVYLTRLAQFTHVAVRDVLAIDFHTVHMLPHTVTDNGTPLRFPVVSKF